MKKILSGFLIISLILYTVILPIPVEAKTIKDLRNEVDKLERDMKNNQSEQALTSKQIDDAKFEVADNVNKISIINNEITRMNKEIEELNVEIEKKAFETEELFRFFQLTTGNAAYLEYIFGAATMTDFIYRLSIVEQLSKYNNELIKTMNELIRKNEKTKKELAAKEVQLKERQITLAENLKKLDSMKSTLYAESQELADEIKTAREVIELYSKLCSSETQDIKTCTDLPPDTAFWRPIIYGYVTSEYGYRTNPITGKVGEFHTGIDISYSTGLSTKVYAAAAGKVAAVTYDNSCGNQITLHHNINGKNYSTSYCHLSSVLVRKGDVIDKDTVIAYMGSTGDSTGPHVHFIIATGLRYIDYVDYNVFVSHTVNPRTLVNFPARNVTWSNRTSKY